MAIMYYVFPPCTSTFSSETSQSRSFISWFLSYHSTNSILSPVFMFVYHDAFTYSSLSGIHITMTTYKVKVTQSKSSVYKCILGANVGTSHRRLNPNKPATRRKIKQKRIAYSAVERIGKHQFCYI